jgi:hypothetical protein
MAGDRRFNLLEKGPIFRLRIARCVNQYRDIMLSCHVHCFYPYSMDKLPETGGSKVKNRFCKINGGMIVKNLCRDKVLQSLRAYPSRPVRRWKGIDLLSLSERRWPYWDRLLATVSFPLAGAP